MKSRIYRMLLVVALLVPLSGCPTSSPDAVALGLWVVTIVRSDPHVFLISLIIEAGGQTQEDPPSPPLGVTSTLTGDVTWVQNGSTISLMQVDTALSFVYTGAVHSSTSMSGTWTQTSGGVASGTWSALWLPSVVVGPN